jgi:hypothetical protein
LSQAQLVDLVLSGRASGGGPDQSAESVISSALLSQLAGLVAPRLGLDVIRIQRSEVQSTTSVGAITETQLELGKHLTDRVYVGFAHIFGAPENQNANEAQLEYRIARRWLLETVLGDAGVGGLDLIWTYRH